MNARDEFDRYLKGAILDLSKQSDLFEVELPRITKEKIPDLLEFLKSNPDIISLRVEGCDLGDNIALGLMENQSIKSLSIGGNNISIDGYKALSKNKSIVFLNCSHCKLGDKEAIALAKAYSKNVTIKGLILINNNIADDGAVALANMCLSHKSLERIDLKGNIIEEKGARALANVLNNKQHFKILVNPQTGSALPNNNIIKSNQWRVLINVADDPQIQANKEREVGLKSGAASLLDMGVFAISNNPVIKEKAEKDLPDDINKIINKKKM